MVAKAVVIIIDSSGSMGGSRWTKAVQATKVVLDTLGPDDLVTIVDFDNYGYLPNVYGQAYSTQRRVPQEWNEKYGKCLTNQMVPASTKYKALLKDWVDSLTASGGTNFIEAFKTGFEVLKATDLNQGKIARVPAILFMTDGEAPNPTSTINAGQDARVVEGMVMVKIFTFAFGNSITSEVRNMMSTIASENGGESSELLPPPIPPSHG